MRKELLYITNVFQFTTKIYDRNFLNFNFISFSGLLFFFAFGGYFVLGYRRSCAFFDSIFFDCSSLVNAVFSIHFPVTLCVCVRALMFWLAFQVYTHSTHTHTHISKATAKIVFLFPFSASVFFLDFVSTNVNGFYRAPRRWFHQIRHYIKLKCVCIYVFSLFSYSIVIVKVQTITRLYENITINAAARTNRASSLVLWKTVNVWRIVDYCVCVEWVCKIEWAACVMKKMNVMKIIKNGHWIFRLI